MPNTNKSRKPVNLDDALSSIDALLDSANKVEPSVAKARADSAGKSRKVKKTPDSSKTVKKSNTSPVKSKTAKSGTLKRDSKPHRRSKPEAGNINNSKKVKSVDQPVNKPPMTNESGSKESAAIDSASDQDKPADPEKESTLAFTVAEDDITQVLRDLPVLEDILTNEDITMLRSGRRPERQPKIEPAVEQTTTDKIMDMLLTVLSIHEISATELESLHDGIDEILADNKVDD